MSTVSTGNFSLEVRRSTRYSARSGPRDGYMRYPAILWNRRRSAFLCPDCMEPLVMEISDDGTKYTVPADQFFFQSETKKEPPLPQLRLRPLGSSQFRPQNRLGQAGRIRLGPSLHGPGTSDPYQESGRSGTAGAGHPTARRLLSRPWGAAPLPTQHLHQEKAAGTCWRSALRRTARVQQRQRPGRRHVRTVCRLPATSSA